MLSPSISAFASSDPANSRSSAPVVVLVNPNRVGSLHWRTKFVKKLSRALPFLSNWRKDCEYSFLTGIIAKTICAIFQNQMCKNRDFLHVFLASFSADFGRILNAV